MSSPRDAGARVSRSGALRLGALRVRGVLARGLARLAMRLVPPAPLALVAGLPDAEENSLVTALALARRFRGRTVLVARDPELARELIGRTARQLGQESFAERVEVRAKSHPRTPLDLVRASWVFYTHGLFDSPRPAGRRLHVNLWHGTGPKWNANANQSVRIGADALAAFGPVWGAEVARALAMPSGSRLVTGNPRQDVMLAADASSRERLAALGLDPARPVVLWMPTFRRSASAGRVGLREGEPFGEILDPVLAVLVSACAERGVQLVLKTHRHDDDDYAALGVRALSTEEVLAAGLSLYELVGLADALVSDYSSVWVDFLATGRSVALRCPDLESYERERGLNRPGLRELASGIFLESEADVLELLEDLGQGRTFRAIALAQLCEALGVGPLDPGGPSRADVMLEELAALARERFGSTLGISPRED